MKKPKRIIALLGLATLVLTGCDKSLVKGVDSDIVTVTVGDKTVPLKVDNLFNDYLDEADGLLSYYNAVYEVVVRELFETKQIEKRNELYDKADLKVKDVKDEARNNATGGKKYKDELENLLKSYNVEDLDDLREKFVYDLMEVELKEQFYEGGEDSWVYDASKNVTNWDELMQGDGDDYVGYLERRLPYHVRHILVKVGAESDDFVTGKISAKEANDLSGAIEALSKLGEKRPGTDEFLTTFGKIAEVHSQDEGSAEQYGDLGIMSTKTSFVNEFKLGVYVYDKIYNVDPNPAREPEKIIMPTEAENYFTNELEIGKIPFGAHLKLHEYQDDVKATDGREVNKGDAAYYPRNIIFNKYFNKHNVSVIVPHDVEESTPDGLGAYKAEFGDLPGFKAVPELGGEKVLTDEHGNVILVVRAGTSGGYEGVHFILVERSAIVPEVNGVTLAEYYTVETPKSDNYPKEGDVDKDTFVNYLSGDESLYKSRAEKIRADVKTFDPNIKERIFEKLVELLDVKFSSDDLKQKLDTYLENQRARETYREDREDTTLWKEWVDYLKVQEYTRSTRLIDEEYIADFFNAVDYYDYLNPGN